MVIFNFEIQLRKYLGEKMCQLHSEKFFFVRPVLAVKPSSVSDSLKGRYHTISD